MIQLKICILSFFSKFQTEKLFHNLKYLYELYLKRIYYLIPDNTDVISLLIIDVHKYCKVISII